MKKHLERITSIKATKKTCARASLEKTDTQQLLAYSTKLGG